MERKTIFSVVILGVLLLFYNNCGRFNTIDVQTASYQNNQASQNNSNEDSSSVSPTPQPLPSPQSPSPSQVPLPTPTPPVMTSKAWSNQPSGLKVIMDCPFSGTLCEGWENVYKTQAFANFSNAPLSPGSVLDTYLGAGSTTGNGQWIVRLANPREVFVGTWWSTNAEFEGNRGSVANKMIFISGKGNNNFLNWKLDDGRNTAGTLTWSFQQTDGSNNCHISGYYSPGCTHGPDYGPGSGDLQPNGPATGKIAAGSGWHKIEIYQKSSSSTTSRDGIIQIWVDGNLHTNYNNVNISPEGFIDTQINHTWDGGAWYDCPNRDCRRAWHHYWDHFYISVR